VPQQRCCRWFVRRGATTKFERGFRSKPDAANWIVSLGSLDWRAGFVFRLHSDSGDAELDYSAIGACAFWFNQLQ